MCARMAWQQQHCSWPFSCPRPFACSHRDYFDAHSTNAKSHKPLRSKWAPLHTAHTAAVDKMDAFIGDNSL